MYEFLALFLAQLVSYFLVAMNQRAMAQGLYRWTAITDLAYASTSFLLIRWVATGSPAQLGWALAGYTLGGTVGSLVAIWLSKRLYGQ